MTRLPERGSSRCAPARPEHWTRARHHLVRADHTLAGIIRSHPRIALTVRGDPFHTLARSIVGQQISVKAADAIAARLVATCGALTPAALLRRRTATLRNCGLSQRKAEYLRDLARHCAAGKLDFAALCALDDEQVIERLTGIRGIGRWTAEMFLIFNLERPDVLPLDDLGLLKAVSRHYLDGAPTAHLLGRDGRTLVQALAQRWAPFRSVATWYLWRSLDPLPVDY